MDEKELIVKARGGDLDAFSELVRYHQASVRACLAVRLQSKHEAEDLAQEAFLVAYKKLSHFDLEQSFGPWIRAISFNLLRNYWRKHKPIPIGGSAELETLIDEQIGLRYSESSESLTLAALKRCIAKLDPPMRQLLSLRYREGQSISELTKRLNVRHSTVTMRLHRLRHQLRQCIVTTGAPYEL